MFFGLNQMDIDKHTVEEAIGQVLQLADMENTGYVSSAIYCVCMSVCIFVYVYLC